MVIEKGLMQAPLGIEEEVKTSGKMPEPNLEIDIVNPDMVTLDDGSVEITLVPGAENDDTEFDANLAETLDEDILESTASELLDVIESDMDSRKDWADTYVKGLDVLGFQYEERSDPWEGACGVYSTVLAEAAIRLNMKDYYIVLVYQVLRLKKFTMIQTWAGKWLCIYQQKTL
jgi:hypothetical protein